MTSAFITEGSLVRRRCELGEVFEALEGPVLEESVNVMRLRVKSLKAGDEGWVSVASNLGTKYLEEANFGTSSDVCKVLNDVPLTDDLDSDKVVRELKQGDTLENIEPSKTSGKSVLRVRGRARGDGKSGWVTVAENGKLFLALP